MVCAAVGGGVSFRVIYRDNLTPSRARGPAADDESYHQDLDADRHDWAYHKNEDS